LKCNHDEFLGDGGICISSCGPFGGVADTVSVVAADRRWPRVLSERGDELG